MRSRVYWNPYTGTRTRTRTNVNAPFIHCSWHQTRPRGQNDQETPDQDHHPQPLSTDSRAKLNTRSTEVLKTYAKSKTNIEASRPQQYHIRTKLHVLPLHVLPYHFNSLPCWHINNVCSHTVMTTYLHRCASLTCTGVPHDAWQHSVSPLVSGQVKLSVQLSEWQRLRVQWIILHNDSIMSRMTVSLPLYLSLSPPSQ